MSIHLNLLDLGVCDPDALLQFHQLRNSEETVDWLNETIELLKEGQLKPK